MAKFCTNCGKSLDGAAAFCRYCGAPLESAAEPQAQQPQQAQNWQAQQPQWQQPAGECSAPRTQQGQTQAAPWQQPSAANAWHAAPGSVGGGQWTVPPTASRSPAERITHAWENYQDSRQPAVPQPAQGGPGTRFGIPAPGYSDRVNDPELLAALAKQRRAAKRAASFVPIPLVAFAVYGMISDKMEFSKALLYGAIVSAIFLICSLLGKKQSSSKNAYEGIVVDKQSRIRRRSSGSSSDRRYETYTELITLVRTSTGEQKKIVENDKGRTLAWDYLQVGERFRYHPEHSFPYELYDKSRAPFLYCVVCQKKNPVTEDRCKKCGVPLLK